MGVRQVVEPVLLQPPRMGLLASATIVDEPDERWVNGFEWTPEICDPDDFGLFDLCENPAWEIDGSNVGETQEFVPYGLWLTVRCSTFGSFQEELQRRAERAVAVSESAGIAYELWTGTIAQASGFPNNYLADSPTILEGGTAQDPIKALTELEEAAAGAAMGAGRRMIHAHQGLATYWYSLGLLRREGNLLLTVHDTIVVADAAYPGTGPAGEAADSTHSWAYTTGMVQVRRGAVQVLGPARPQISDDNVYEIVAWRPAAATFDPCALYAINVNHTNTTEITPP